MLSTLSIRGRLLTSVAVSIGFLTLLAGVNLYGQNRSGAALQTIQKKAVQPMMALQEMDSLLKDIRFNMAGTSLEVFSYTGAANHLKEARARLPLAWQEFKGGFDADSASADERSLVEAVGGQMNDLAPFFDELAAAYAKEEKSHVIDLLQNRWPIIQKKLAKPLSQLVPLRAEEVRQTFEASTAEGRKLNTLAITAYLLCVAGLLLLVLPLVSSMSRAIQDLKSTLSKVAGGDLGARPNTSRQDELGDMARSLDTTISSLHDIISGVQNAARQLADTTRQVLTAIDEIITRGNTHAAVMSRVSESIGNMSAAAREIADGSGKVAEASNEASSVAASGNIRMESALAAAQRTEEAVEGSASVITELSSATDRINEVTQVIREIADQTNLLALNAAIEAARAGEQGRGFAVVADEVRKLAERTSSSTADIAGTVGTIRSQTHSAVDAMRRVREEVAAGADYSRQTCETLNAIVTAAEKVTGLAQGIAAATQQQMSVSNATVNDMTQVSGMSTENAQSLNRVDAITRDLTQMAQQLQQLIGRFRV